MSLGPERPPDLLQLLPQPGGEGLPEAVQQLGQVHVVVPVVPGQVRMGLGGGGQNIQGRSEVGESVFNKGQNNKTWKCGRDKRKRTEGALREH